MDSLIFPTMHDRSVNSCKLGGVCCRLLLLLLSNTSNAIVGQVVNVVVKQQVVTEDFWFLLFIIAAAAISRSTSTTSSSGNPNWFTSSRKPLVLFPIVVVIPNSKNGSTVQEFQDFVFVLGHYMGFRQVPQLINRSTGLVTIVVSTTIAIVFFLQFLPPPLKQLTGSNLQPRIVLFLCVLCYPLDHFLNVCTKGTKDQGHGRRIAGSSRSSSSSSRLLQSL
mmetsp:Transcript_20025/g.49197  ORF Transcript_20025/g.49197 Transcript_20025/m.49197 type:complete len:221 (-) Transcript_20025:995-1657(-)